TGNDARRDVIELRKAHEEHERFGDADFVPVDLRNIMAGDEGDDGCVIAMRERHARIRRDAKWRGHAGDDFEWHARIGKRLGLLPPAPEDKRIAALEPYHIQAAAGAIDQHGADLALRNRVIGLLLAYIDPLGRRR